MNEKISGGYYLKARRIQQSEISHAPPHVREIWDWLLLHANHKEKKYGKYTVKRGQLFRTYNDIREGLHWLVGWRKMMYHENHVKKAMKILREYGMITTQKALGGVLITIVNYAKFQNPKNYEGTTEDTTDRTIEEPLKNHPIPDNNKNVKNEEKENNTGEPSSQKVVTPVNQVFDVFYNSINPTINYGNKTSREACEWMIDKWGLEKTIEVAKYACSIHGQRFSPTITTPYELKDKISKLKAFREQREAEKPQGVTILRKQS